MGKLLNYHRFENFLKPDLAQDLLHYCIRNRDYFKEATVNKGAMNIISKDYRSSLVYRDLGEFKDQITASVTEVVPEIFDKLQISPFTIKAFETEIAAHGNGAFFKEHIDTLTGKVDREKARAISVVYYFFSEPKQFEGGELRLIPVEFISGDDKAIALTPLHNSLLVFPSFAPHEVLPIRCPNVEFSGWRFTVNCWIYK